MDADLYIQLCDVKAAGSSPGIVYIQFPEPLTFKSVTDIFVSARYSLNAVSIADRNLVFAFHGSLLEKTRVNMSPFKYFIFKYLLGKF